jgi:hypothetical protein
MASASGQIATDDLLAIYREVSGVSERAGAIVIVAFIEDSLAQVIRRRLRPLTNREEEALFEGVQAPLNTLYAKIHFGYLIWLYGKAQREDLLVVKNIRNIFAHDTSARDFRHPKIGRLCSKLHYTSYEAYCQGKPEQTDAKEQFHDAANHLMTGLRFMLSPSFKITKINHISSPLRYPERASGSARGGRKQL